jgi:sialic acid synthase SpsE
VPAGAENLLAIRSLATAFGAPVGFSDHGADTFAWPMAVALGASLYERHLVLEGDDEAIDRAVSSTPAALAAAVRDGRRAWAALGTGRKRCLDVEAPNLVPSRRSWCAARALPAGTILTAGDLVALRPATGLPPAALPAILGRALRADVPMGQPITAALLSRALSAEADRVA